MPFHLPPVFTAIFPAVVVDEGHSRVPVLPGKYMAEKLRSLPNFFMSFFPSLRNASAWRALDPGLRVVVLAVDDGTRAGVIRNAEELAVELAGALEPRKATSCVRVRLGLSDWNAPAAMYFVISGCPSRRRPVRCYPRGPRRASSDGFPCAGTGCRPGRGVLRIERSRRGSDSVGPTVLGVVLEPDDDLRGVALRRSPLADEAATARMTARGAATMKRAFMSPPGSPPASPRGRLDWFSPPTTAREIGIDHYRCRDLQKPLVSGYRGLDHSPVVCFHDSAM